MKEILNFKSPTSQTSTTELGIRTKYKNLEFYEEILHSTSTKTFELIPTLPTNVLRENPPSILLHPTTDSTQSSPTHRVEANPIKVSRFWTYPTAWEARGRTEAATDRALEVLAVKTIAESELMDDCFHENLAAVALVLEVMALPGEARGAAEREDEGGDAKSFAIAIAAALMISYPSFPCCIHILLHQPRSSQFLEFITNIYEYWRLANEGRLACGFVYVFPSR